MQIQEFIQKMPKVELHVHLEGSIQPETLLQLAWRNNVSLPANTLDGLQKWYKFQDFMHFIQIYKTISACLRSPQDLELITREFLKNQAEQNIHYSEVTFTSFTHYETYGIPFTEQLSAINQARTWAAETLDTHMNLVIDIDRQMPAKEAELISEWVLQGYGKGVCAIGLGGPEMGNPPEKFIKPFERVISAGIPSVPHAGEVEGPQSIWGALNVLKADRIGHGVRCLEDTDLVKVLRERQIPLEVCPTSNICLGVFESLEKHPLPRLLDEGLYVTINSDDPPMFNTSLTNEYLQIHKTFGFGPDLLKKLVLNALNASFYEDKENLKKKFETEFRELHKELKKN